MPLANRSNLTRFAFVISTVLILLTAALVVLTPVSGTRMTRGDTMVNEVAGDEQQYNPALAVSSDGVVYAAWEDRRNNYDVSDIYFANSTDGGNNFGVDVMVHWEVTPNAP